MALVSLVDALPALAHHSTAMYDYKNTKTLSGTVKAFQWTNPHMFIKVMVPDAQGKEVEWAVECGMPNINARHGWKRTDIKVGASCGVPPKILSRRQVQAVRAHSTQPAR